MVLRVSDSCIWYFQFVSIFPSVWGQMTHNQKQRFLNCVLLNNFDRLLREELSGILALPLPDRLEPIVQVKSLQQLNSLINSQS